MAFGFGFSKSKNNASSNSSDQIEQTAGSEYGSSYDSGNRYESGGRSGYDNFSGGNWQDTMFGGQQRNNMMNQFGGMWNQFMGPGGPMSQMQGMAPGMSNDMSGVADAGMGAYEKLMAGGATGAAGQQINPALMESLQTSLSGPSQMGQMYESIVGGEGNTYIDPMIDRMRGDENIRQNRTASGITGGAVGAGQSGSSRHGIAEGLMRSEGNRALGDREAIARMGGYDKDLAMKMDIAKNADIGRGQTQDRAIGLLGAGDQNTQFGLGQGQNMQNMMMGQMAPWMQSSMMPFQMANMYSGAMGPGQVMGGGSYGSGGSGFSDNFSGGEGFDSGSSGGSSFEDYMRDFFSNSQSSGSSMGVSGGM